MRISVIVLTLLLALAIPVHSRAETPIMTAVAPAVGTIGDLFVVQGTYLDEGAVAALFMTDGKNDIKVVITEQTATSIKFKVPPEAKAGRFALMVLTKGKDARYVEEPVKITIETAEKPAT